MNDRATLEYVRQAEHDALSAQMAAFLAGGGRVEVLRIGQVTDDALLPRDQKPKVGLPHVNRPRDNLPKAKPRESRANMEKIDAALKALREGCTTCAEVAERTGEPKASTATRLWKLSTQGVVFKRGGRFDTTWFITADHPQEARQ